MFLYTILLIGVTAVVAEIPSYIKICKRNDPKVEECVLSSIENLRPRLKSGIPELNVPPLEPLLIKEVEIANGQDATRLRIYGRDIYVKGASGFQVHQLKIDLTKPSQLLFNVDLTIPRLDLDGNYDLNAKLLLLPLKGKGEIHVNVTNVNADAAIQGQIYKKGNNNYLRFTTVDMRLDMKDFDIQLSNLFGGDPALSEVANRIIKENKEEFGKALNPIIAKTVSKVVLNIANKVTENTPYDEVFPIV